MKLPVKTHYFGLPIFYEIKLKNGNLKRARFDDQRNIWLTQGENRKIENKEIDEWRLFGQNS